MDIDIRKAAVALATFFVALAFTTGVVVAQTDFSADIVNLKHPDNPFQTKIYSAKNKLRFEGRDTQGRTGSIMIVDLATRHSIVLMPQQQMYVEESKAQIPGQGVTFFRASDAGNACAEWKKVAGKGLAKCEKIGPDTVNGRAAVKYDGETVTEMGTEKTSVWVDNALHFPVKWQGPVGSGELRNILEGAQGAELFAIPAGYTKRHFVQQQAKPALP
jgi:hypothetical protein